MERSHLTDADIVKYYEPWPPNCKKVKIYSILTVGFHEAVVGWDFEKNVYQTRGQKWGLAKPRFVNSSCAQRVDGNERYEGALKPENDA